MVELCSTPENDFAMEQMAEENARLLNFLYACPVGLMEVSSDGVIEMMNPVAMQFMLRLNPIPTNNLLDAMTTHAPELRNLMNDFQPQQGTVCENHRILVRTGRERPGEVEVLSCTLVKLGPERYIVSLSDISNQVRQERKLKEAETWFASLLGGASDFGVLSLQESGGISSVSASFSRQLGFPEDDLLGRNLSFLEASAASQGAFTVEDQLAIAAREGWHLTEDWHRHYDGSKGWYQRLVTVRNNATETGGISGYTVVMREGQQRSIDAHRLKKMLTRDQLTGTYNRMHFFELVERECVRKRRYPGPVSLVMADIDFFKQVNDRHGHAAGDEVLKRFATVCMDLLRPSDSIARIGGEEFAILLPGTGLNGASQFAERLRQAVIDNHKDLATAGVAVTASFGCAELSDACSLPALMADADAALYKAKHAGRNCVVASHSPGETHAGS